MGLTRGEARVHVDASSERVYELVSDVTRMGEWSPETYRCEWIDGADGPAVGARFRAWNRNRGVRWSNRPEVIAADPGHDFAFTRSGFPGSGEVVWRYRMQPSGSGCELMECYEVVKQPARLMLWLTDLFTGTRDRQASLLTGMQTTLTRIKAAAESAPPA